MALLKSRLQAAADAHKLASDRLADFQRQRAAKANECESEADFDRGLTLRDELADLDRKIEVAQGALAHNARGLAQAKAAAEEAEGDRSHAEAEKRAKADASLTLEILDLSNKLADKIARLQEGVAIIKEANAKRGNRPFISDGEQRVREIAAHTLPRIVRFEEQWLDENKERAGMLRVNDRGEMVPMRGGYTLQKMEVEVRPETHVPASMPERLAHAIRLVGKNGEKLWPR